MADDSVVIRAELVGNIAEEAEKNRAALKQMTDGVGQGFADTGTAVGKLNTHLDTFAQQAGDKTKQPVDKLTASLGKFNEAGSKLRESAAGIGESITQHLRYPIQMLTYSLEAAAAGMITLGATTNMTLQGVRTQLGVFGGGAGGAFGSLYGMSGAVPLSTLQQGLYTGQLAGMGTGQSTALLRAITSAAEGTHGSGAGAMVGPAMQAFADVKTHMGLTSASDIAAIAAIDPSIFGQLGNSQGMSANAERHLFALGGQNMINPNLLYSLFENSSQARTGSTAYNSTTAGQLEQLKKNFSLMLSDLETPLVGLLSHGATGIGHWAKGVSHRFTQDQGQLGKEWGAGNMGGFSGTLASVLGDPKLKTGIDDLIKFGQDLDHIFTGAVVPALKTFGEVAMPVFGFLADHPHLLDGLVLGFTGLMVIDKLNGPLTTLTGLLRLFTTEAGEGGAAGAAKALGRGLLGMSADEGAASGTAGLSGMGAAGIFAALAVGQDVNYHDALKQGYVQGAPGTPWMSMRGVNSIVQHPGRSLLHPVSSFENLFGLGAHKTTASHVTVHNMNMNITATHANPEKVANAVPKAFNAQVTNLQRMQARRQPKSPNQPQPASKRG